MDLMIRRGVLSTMGAKSSGTAVVNDSTKSLEMNWSASNRSGTLSRLFDRCPLRVIYLAGIKSLDGPGYFFQHMYDLKAAIFPDATTVSANYLLWAAESNNIQEHGTYTAVDFHKAVSINVTCPFRLDGGGDMILRADELSTSRMTATTWGVNKNMQFYVPQALLTAYREAENWNTFEATNFHAIEGSKYENVNWWKSIT